MSSIKSRLMEAEAIAVKLFSEIEDRGLIIPGKTENQLNNEIFWAGGGTFWN